MGISTHQPSFLDLTPQVWTYNLVLCKCALWKN